MSRRSYNKNYSPGRQLATEETSNSNFSNFAPRRANKLKEFFGLNSIQKNLLPRARRGDTSKLGGYIRFNRNIRLAGSFAVIMLMFIATGIIVPYYIKSAETEAAGESHFGDALLTFSSESLAASVTLSNLAAEGSFATSTSAQQAKFSISTTNYTGYTLAIQAAEDTVLSGAKGGSLTAIPQSVTTAQYTANNIANVNLNNTWGFLPNYYKSGSNIVANTDTYLPISTTDSTILDETTNANTEAKQYTISLGARADYTNTVDTFSNIFILQYIANPVNYAVTYNKNAGSDTVTNMPYENNVPQYVQAGHVEATSITLSNLVPVRENYAFLGWCSEATGTPVDNSDTCAGTIYNDQTEGATPNLTLNLSQTEANESTLYAMWHQEFSINNVTTMQQWNTLSSAQKQAAIDTMVEGTAYTLIDTRDNGSESYQVAKLADGNVWMLENLRLGGTSEISLDGTNTNLPNGTTFTLPAGITSNFGSSTAAQINVASKNTVASVKYGTQGSGKIGVYYDYAAASAGKIKGYSNSSNGDPNQDICPAGWRLPTGGSSGEFQTLYTAYSSNATNFRNALSLPLSGYFYNSSARDQGSYGYFWSSTRYNDTDMYRLFVNESSVNPQDYDGRSLGYSVRCVLKSSGLDTNITFSPNGADSGSATTLTLTSGSDTLSDPGFTKNGYFLKGWNTAADGSGASYLLGTTVTAGMNGLTLYPEWSNYMQDMRIANKDTQCPSTANTTVYDKRDGKAYTVKQMDGYCIMTKNLAYIGGNNGTASAGNAVSANGTSFTMTSSKLDTYTSPYYYRSNIDNYGVYYNYCAASGKQRCMNSSTAGSAATDSICPAGWMLPTSPSSSSWGGISTTTIMNSGDFNVYAGYYDSGNLYNVGSIGFWWSATPYPSGTYLRFYLYFNGSDINAQYSGSRDSLFSVRCVLSR